MLVLFGVVCFRCMPVRTVLYRSAVPSADIVPQISSPPRHTARHPAPRAHRHTTPASVPRDPVPPPFFPAPGRESLLPARVALPPSLVALASFHRSSQTASLRLVLAVPAVAWQPAHKDLPPTALPLPLRFPSAAQFASGSPSSSARSYLVPFLHC